MKEEEAEEEKEEGNMTVYRSTTMREVPLTL
jgi:hypothetical protein